jgi:hypothetical protein
MACLRCRARVPCEEKGETINAKIKKNQEGNKAAQKNATKTWNAKHESGKVSIVK